MVQFVYLTAGYYDLSFWYRPRTDTFDDNGIDVLFIDQTNVVLSADGISSEITDWQQYSVQLYTPDSGLLGIGFHATGLSNSLGGFVDDVELNSIPEPATMILFGTGLIVIAGLGRKKFLKK